MKQRRASWSTALLTPLLILVLCGSIFAEERYRVKSGDSLSSVSKKFGVSVADLKEANRLESSALKPKQVLVIPVKHPPRGSKSAKKAKGETVSYTVKKGETLYTVSEQFDVSVQQIKKMNGLRSTRLAAGQKLLLPRPRKAPVEYVEDLDEEAEADAGPSEEAGALRQDDIKRIGNWSGPEERQLLVKVTKAFIGVPYRLGGTTLKGIDCSAFVQRVYGIFDVPLPRTAREQSRAGMNLTLEELKEGDLVFFKTRRSGLHVGIYIGNHQFVHTSSQSRQAKVDSMESAYFQERFVKGVRVKGLEETGGLQARSHARPIPVEVNPVHPAPVPDSRQRP